jgi:hypothetical protein
MGLKGRTDDSKVEYTRRMTRIMSQQSRHEVLKNLQYHYQRAAGGAAKGALLDSAQKMLGVGRKYLIRKLNAPTDSRPPRPRTGRPAAYGAPVLAALRSLWMAMDQPCSKHLKAGLRLWIPSWEAHHGPFVPAVRQALERISPAQMDRLLKNVRVNCPPKHRPRAANDVRAQIPIRQGPWQTSGPGWFEADTVFHNGGDPSGSFVRSLCMTDIYSGWTEVRATWNQSHLKVHERLREIESTLPFALVGFDTDNGPEMINEAVLSYLRKRGTPVEVTRSRPYHKNDNAHVEQKNRTHVREFIGYDRMDNMALVSPLNEAYIAWSLWRNLYRPSSKLLSKERVGAKMIKRHERAPLTPCERILAHPQTTAATKECLAQLLARHDPLTLWGTVQEHLREFAREQKALLSPHTEHTEHTEHVEGEAGGATDNVRVLPGSGPGRPSSLRSLGLPEPAPSRTQTLSAKQAVEPPKANKPKTLQSKQRS